MFSPHRIWTAESIASFRAERDERGAKKGLPPFSKLGPGDRATFLEQERQEIVDNGQDQLVLQVRPALRLHRDGWTVIIYE